MPDRPGVRRHHRRRHRGRRAHRVRRRRRSRPHRPAARTGDGLRPLDRDRRHDRHRERVRRTALATAHPGERARRRGRAPALRRTRLRPVRGARRRGGMGARRAAPPHPEAWRVGAQLAPRDPGPARDGRAGLGDRSRGGARLPRTGRTARPDRRGARHRSGDTRERLRHRRGPGGMPPRAAGVPGDGPVDAAARRRAPARPGRRRPRALPGQPVRRLARGGGRPGDGGGGRGHLRGAARPGRRAAGHRRRVRHGAVGRCVDRGAARDRGRPRAPAPVVHGAALGVWSPSR